MGENYRHKKRLGQNFLVSEEAISKIVSLLDLHKDDSVVEIGPGLGALTVPLAVTGARIIAVEFDRDLIPKLRDSLDPFENANVIRLDFLRFNPEDHALKCFKLVGNIPYNITTPVLEWCATNRSRISLAVLMMQRELADRICAAEGSRHWSPLSIFTQISFHVVRALELDPSRFNPEPAVSSTVITLTPRKKGERSIPRQFEAIVRASFRHKRKQLVNNLVPDIVATTDEYDVIIKKLDLKPNVRAEELSIDMFLKLTCAITGDTIE